MAHRTATMELIRKKVWITPPPHLASALPCPTPTGTRPALPCPAPALAADEPARSKWYSHTQFADMWRWLVSKNPFYMASECRTSLAGVAAAAAAVARPAGVAWGVGVRLACSSERRRGAELRRPLVVAAAASHLMPGPACRRPLPPPCPPSPAAARSLGQRRHGGALLHGHPTGGALPCGAGRAAAPQGGQGQVAGRAGARGGRWRGPEWDTPPPRGCRWPPPSGTDRRLRDG